MRARASAAGTREAASWRVRCQRHDAPRQRARGDPGHARQPARALHRPGRSGGRLEGPRAGYAGALAETRGPTLGRDSPRWHNEGTSSEVPAVEPLRLGARPAPLVQAPPAGAPDRGAGQDRTRSMAGSCSACQGLEGLLGRHLSLSGRGRSGQGSGVWRSASTCGFRAIQGSDLWRSDQKDKEREISREHDARLRGRGSEGRRWGWARGGQGRERRARPTDRPPVRPVAGLFP